MEEEVARAKALEPGLVVKCLCREKNDIESKGRGQAILSFMVHGVGFAFIPGRVGCQTRHLR